MSYLDSRTEAAAKTRQFQPFILTHVQERIGLPSDPLVYPCEYVSKRRRPTTHELLAFSALLKINAPSIA